MEASSQVKIVIAGASGLLGRALTNELKKAGCKLILLSRDPSKIPQDAQSLILSYADFVRRAGNPDLAHERYLIFNFAGESLGAKFIGPKRLAELTASRLQIIDMLAKAQGRTLAFYQGSGYTAKSPRQDDPFLIFALKVEQAAVRAFPQSQVYLLRFGLLLSPEALLCRMLKKMPGLYFLDGGNHLPVIDCQEAAERLRGLALEDLQKSKHSLNPSILDIASGYPTLNELLTKIQGKRLRLPLLRLALRFLDRRGRLLDYDLKA